MRRILVALAAVTLALGLVGATPEPADAHYMPEGAITWEPFPGGCLLESTYGTFGNGFAQITLRPGLSPACSLSTAVEVTTAHDGHVHSRYCSIAGVIDNPPTSFCVLSINPTVTLRAVQPGTAFAMRVVAINLNGVRYETTHGAFG